jgi:hypothetical protein
MSERQKRDHCVGILLDEICAAMAGELRDESRPVPPVSEGFHRLDRPDVLRILVRTKPRYREHMADFVSQHRPDLREYLGKCLEYLRQRAG